MKVLVLMGSQKKDAPKEELTPIAEVWIQNGQAYVRSEITGVERALRREITGRLESGPILRRYAKYLGPQDAPHTITDARAPVSMDDPAVLDWWRDERIFWETHPIAGYYIDAFYSEVVER